jgi:hypothetical protein
MISTGVMGCFLMAGTRAEIFCEKESQFEFTGFLFLLLMKRMSWSSI